MGFHPPTLWSMQSSNGYALQFGAPHPFAKFFLRTAGECWVKPIFAKPTVTNATTSSSKVSAGNGGTIVVASATNIAVGSFLTIADSNQEGVLVTALSGTTVTADFGSAHDGTSTPLTITNLVFPTAPTGSPAPSSGAPRAGWLHLSIAGESYGQGVEAAPAAGTPYFAGGASDLIYGCLIWCVTGAELLVIGH